MHSFTILCLSLALLLLNLWGSGNCVIFQASVNMAGVSGQVTFDSILQTATLNVNGSCSSTRLSLMEFPVMYGHFLQPCHKVNIGSEVFAVNVSEAGATANVSALFKERQSLDDLSLVLETCNALKACATIWRIGKTRTWQARFFEPVAGDVYIRQNEGETAARVLSSLVSLQSRFNADNAEVYLSQSLALSCKMLLNSFKPSALTLVGKVAVGSPVQSMKSRLDISSFGKNISFVLLKLRDNYTCAEVREMEKKVVHALIDMKGAKGLFTFSQGSPFETTEIKVNLTNLRKMVGHYHVHLFPLPQKITPQEEICSNDNVGSHWNPFNVNVTDSSYPRAPGASHDKYEVGDLSGRHGSLLETNNFEATFIDWNLPLFGINSIIGRSVVIHMPNGTRHLCGSIGYPGDVTVAKATFRSPVVGTIVFTQLKGNSYSDVSIFVKLAYGKSSLPATHNHNWHIHAYPIRTETDDDAICCWSTGSHWNPFNINISDSSYAQNCRPENPFACEIGDLTGKHTSLNIVPDVGKVQAKYFFTDSTSWVTGIESMTGRSMVIHGADGASSRAACANITNAHLVSAQTTVWFGPGKSQGQVRFLQGPTEVTFINVSLSNLDLKASSFHVHVLPIKASGDPCSDENIMGHFNPLDVKQSSSPAPGVGTVDQYEIGDISGKFGLLTDLNQTEKEFTDVNMPLSGPNSIVGRSLVIHYLNESRMQCANIVADSTADGHWVKAKAVFSGIIIGTIKLSQQTFQDGSYSDTILEVDLRISEDLELKEAFWYIHEGPAANLEVQCARVGNRFNPFNMSEENTSCSVGNPLTCEVGDLTTKHGAIKLTMRQLFTETNIQLMGDFTVVYRSIVLQTSKGILACATIQPVSPSAKVIFPKVTSFSRFDFRSRVAGVLAVDPSRVTILPGSLSSEAGGKCQQVSFLVSGDVATEALDLVKDSDRMGKFKYSAVCQQSENAGQPRASGKHFLVLMMVAAQLPFCALLQ
ncbi:hypothetical protein GN956_G12638 [Arapaima gigas]